MNDNAGACDDESIPGIFLKSPQASCSWTRIDAVYKQELRTLND